MGIDNEVAEAGWMCDILLGNTCLSELRHVWFTRVGLNHSTIEEGWRGQGVLMIMHAMSHQNMDLASR